MTQIEGQRKMEWLIKFFDNQAIITRDRYHDEKLSNVNAMTRDLIKAIWYMDSNTFDEMAKEGLAL